MAIISNLWSYPRGGPLAPDQYESWAIGPFPVSFDGTMHVSAHPFASRVPGATAVTFTQMAIDTIGQHYINFVVKNTHTTPIEGFSVKLSTIEFVPGLTGSPTEQSPEGMRFFAVHDSSGTISRAVGCPTQAPPMLPATIEPGHSITEIVLPEGFMTDIPERIVDMIKNYRVEVPRLGTAPIRQKADA